ncbi:GNAT family N-acetyltransferase [Kineococcus sp. SYSU DK006]|uniref:GNAT family N-acetyltransferase n=1 Tax=Kineococcus sp. SYSU DK006 TaxID=3383127 RepID=UPI003D7E0118
MRPTPSVPTPPVPAAPASAAPAPVVVTSTSSDAADRSGWAARHFDAWYDELVAGQSAGRPDPACWQRAELRAELERGSAEERVHWLLAHRDGRAVGAAEVRLTLLDNLHVAAVELAVGPEHRRRGVGTRLLGAALDVAAAAGRTSVRTAVEHPVQADPARWPGLLAARRWGFERGRSEARRQLQLPVPAGRLEALEAGARPHAEGYRLRAWAGPVPEQDLDAVAALAARMSTDAPSGDLRVEPEAWDAARVRENEAARAAQGRRQWLAVAAAPSGELVGYTMLVQSAHEPERLLQWDTLVVREHRGHRLGTLLKVACLRAAVADAPQARRVTTWNAVSNAPMIAVNEALGFRWDETVEELEADVADVRAALAR